MEHTLSFVDVRFIAHNKYPTTTPHIIAVGALSSLDRNPTPATSPVTQRDILHPCVVVNTDRAIEVGTSATFIVTTVLSSTAAFGSVFSLAFWLR